MDAKLLRKVRESFGRCTLRKGFYDDLLKNLQTNSVEIDLGGTTLEANLQKQLLKNDLAFLLLAAGEQQSGKIALSRLAKQRGKSMLHMSKEQNSLWTDALLSSVRNFDHRFTQEIEAGWQEVVENGFRLIHSQ